MLVLQSITGGASAGTSGRALEIARLHAATNPSPTGALRSLGEQSTHEAARRGGCHIRVGAATIICLVEKYESAEKRQRDYLAM
jgi:hypothetical protein